MRPSTVAAGVVEWAGRTPDSLAILDDTDSITFAELDGLAGALAHRLLERCDGRAATAVPLLVRRDRWALVAIHGAVRAGLPFAPIDATLPPPVVAALLHRLGNPPVVVHAGPEVSPPPLPAGAAVFEVPTVVSDPVPPRAVDIDAVAAVVFTSGSTGRPKGVVLDWRAAESRMAQLATTGQAAAGTRTAVTAPFHWIAGIGRSYALGLGSALAVADRALHDPLALHAWFAATEVERISLVPSTAVRMADQWTGTRLERVRYVSLGGEPMRGDHVAAVRRLVSSDVRVSTQYGASETGGLHVLRFDVGPDDEIPAGRLPLGYPDVDGQLRLDPVGGDGLGEIVIVQPAARGYLDEPPEVAARFGVDGDGTRWWRTGDLARIDADGAYRGAGRMDDMVKINGRLVGPSEPEEVLRAIAGIVDVAVVPYEGRRQTLLVGHVTVDPASELTAGGVYERLRASLAPHLVPRPLVRHDRLPTLPGGKLDRVTLRHTVPEPWRDASPVPAADPVEQWLLDEVCAIVGVDAVAPDDDLFEIGLDSLAVVELCAATAAAGHGGLTPGQVIAHPTVRALRAQLGSPDDADPTVTVFHATGTRRPLFALPGGGGTALRYRALAEALGADRPLVVVEPRGLHARGRVARTVRSLAAHARREIEIRLAPGDGCVVAGYSASGPVAFEVAQQLHAAGRPVHLVLLDTSPAGTERSGPVATVSPSRAGVRDASLTALPGALLRSLRYRATHLGDAYAHWRRRGTRVMGRGRYDADRYETFARIAGRAARSYRPRPAAFPVSLFPIEGSAAEARSAPVAPDLRVYRVSGGHLTMLEYPHVIALAALLESVVDGAFAPSS